MKRARKYLVIALVLTVVGLLVFRLAQKKAPKDSQNAQDAGILVTTAAAVKRKFLYEISAVGTLQAQEVSPLSPKVPGNVAAVLVDIGAPVKAGDVLLELDDTGFNLAAKQAEAIFRQAENQYKRARALLAEKVIPESRFDAAEAAYVISREAWSIAKEHLKNTKIPAPIDGTVVDRTVEVGQSVAPGVQMLRIVNQTSLKMDVDLPEKDLSRVTPETLALIIVDAFPEGTFTGKVVVINPMVKRKTRTFRARIELPNPAGKLVDGMFARVRLSVGEKNALAVPRDALVRLPGSGTHYVFVVDGEKAIKRQVKIGKPQDQFAEILSGLSEGERVVTSGTGRLRSGTRVRVAPSAGTDGPGSEIRQ